MDWKIKKDIEKLREKGYGYKRTAKELNLNLNTVASYCRRKTRYEKFVYCRNCGYRIFKMNKTGRKKIFCNKKCRLAYYKYLKKLNCYRQN